MVLDCWTGSMSVMYVDALRADQLWDGEMVGIEIDGQPILVLKKANEIKAYHDVCCHKGVRLSAGRFDGTIITCWAHGWQYDAMTGRGINPQSVQLTALATQVKDGMVQVSFGSEDANP